MTIEATALEAMSRVLLLEDERLVDIEVHRAEHDVWRLMVGEAMTMIHAQSRELDSVRAQLSALRDEIRRYTASRVAS